MHSSPWVRNLVVAEWLSIRYARHARVTRFAELSSERIRRYGTRA